MIRCIQHERIDTIITKRLNFSDKFKTTAVLEALREDETVRQIAAKCQLQGSVGKLNRPIKKVFQIRNLYSAAHEEKQIQGSNPRQPTGKVLTVDGDRWPLIAWKLGPWLSAEAVLR